MAEAPIALRTVASKRMLAGEILMPRYVFVLRHSSLLPCKTTRPAWNCRTTRLRASSLRK